jgi:hypothetical protein
MTRTWQALTARLARGPAYMTWALACLARVPVRSGLNGVTMWRETVKPLIVGVALIAVFMVLNRVLPGLLSPEAGQAALFFTLLASILTGYISFVAFMSRLLGGRVPDRLHTLLERLFIAGILLGIAGMFQPWVPPLYPLGFVLLFSATWVFTLWGYVLPKSARSSE